MTRAVKPAQTRVEMTQLILPQFTNTHGTVFGGQIAAWCDIAAAVSSQRFCRRPVVTASMDELHFLKPVRQGMTVVLQAMVNQAWHTSMEVGVRVEAEVLETGERVHCCSAYLTFVALDEDGRPCAIPTLDTEGDEDAHHRGEEANLRRQVRLEMRDVRKKARAARGL